MVYKILLLFHGLVLSVVSFSQTNHSTLEQKWIVSLSPNPAVNIITITFQNEKDEFRFMLLDAKNNLISFSKNPMGSGFSLDVINLDKGIYYLQLSNVENTLMKTIRFEKI
jgi:hypothetical protein